MTESRPSFSEALFLSVVFASADCFHARAHCLIRISSINTHPKSGKLADLFVQSLLQLTSLISASFIIWLCGVRIIYSYPLSHFIAREQRGKSPRFFFIPAGKHLCV